MLPPATAPQKPPRLLSKKLVSFHEGTKAVSHEDVLHEDLHKLARTFPKVDKALLKLRVS